MKGFNSVAGAPSIEPMPEKPRRSVFDGNIGPWSRKVGRYKDHTCFVNRYGEIYDYAPSPQGWRYVGDHAQSDDDAFNRWKSYLLETLREEPLTAKRVRR